MTAEQTLYPSIKGQLEGTVENQRKNSCSFSENN
jgi:hypothetical protein